MAEKSKSWVKIANAGNSANIEVCFNYQSCIANDILLSSVDIFHIKWCSIFAMVINIKKYGAKNIHESDWPLKKWHHQSEPEKLKFYLGLENAETVTNAW